MKIKVVIADDLRLFLEGLQLILKREPTVDLVGMASNGKELVEIVARTKPDVVVTDIEMPVMDGIEATKRIREMEDSPGIVGLTMYQEEHLIVDMLEAGANGYILKSNTHEELMASINAAFNKDAYFCNGTSMRLSKMIARSKTSHLQKDDKVELTEKEIEIIKLICEQYASKQIATLTNLAPKKNSRKIQEHNS